MSVIGWAHDRFVFPRRVRLLSEQLIALIPRGARVLDVGCGDGLMADTIARKRPDIAIQGIDVHLRTRTHIPVTVFDGTTIPHSDRGFDIVLLVDVLHHTDDPVILLREAVRVVSHAIVIKDHLSDGFLAVPTLRLIDWVSNAAHGVRLPYNYWPRRQWHQAFSDLGLTVDVWRERLRLYPPPISWIVGRSLHFLTRLRRA